MNIETGEIHPLLPTETLKDLALRLNVAETKLIELSNAPDPGCQNCGGRGFKGISQVGNKIPCPCTNPK